MNAHGGKSLGGMSALQLAARKRNAPMVVSILEARGDTTSLSSAGKTAAEIARTNNAAQIADFLDGTMSESDLARFVSEATAG